MKPVVVFDFDGTLVDSNRLKWNAYFELFPRSPEAKRAISKALSPIYEKSRYVIIERLLDELIRQGLMEEPPGGRHRLLEDLTARYGHIVLEGAKQCPEMPGASELLKELSHLGARLYLSSTTPESPLKEIVAHRGWTGYFQDIFGYPRQKSDTLRQIMEENRLPPHALAVVGDGRSDMESAEETGALFIRVQDGKLPKESILEFVKQVMK